MCKPKVLVICGPTASGKTSLSIELAKRINGEIISCDSMQIYKDMDIGTAKPTEQEKQGIKHYLLDFLSPEVRYSVADYKKDAEKAIEEILKKRKVPIIVGGTGLYINSLIYNIEYKDSKIDIDYRNKLEKIVVEEGLERLCEMAQKIDPEAMKNISNNDKKRIMRVLEIYNKLEKMVVEKGLENLYEMAQKIDPEAMKNISHNDKKRIMRVLEIYNETGKTKTELEMESRKNEPKYNYIVFALDMDRDKLYERINKRVDIMLKNGLIHEVEKLINTYKIMPTAMQGLGYKEVVEYLNGNCTEEEMVEKIKMETRRYAKRQLTWFRKNKETIWLNGLEEVDKNINTILEVYSGRTS